MKNIICFTQFFPPSVGGMQTSNFLLVESLLSKNFSVTLHFFSSPPPSLKHKNLTIIPHKFSPRSLLTNIKCGYTIYTALKKGSYNLALLLDDGMPRALGFLPRNLRKSILTKIFNINSGSFLTRNNITLKAKLSSFFTLRGYAWLDTTFVSEYCANKLKALNLSLPKVQTLGRPIPENYFDEPQDPKKIKEKLSIKNNYPILFSCGRAEDYKGVEHILQALAKMQAKKIRINFIYVGAGPQLLNWKKIAKKLGLEHVFFCGEVKFTEMMHYYDAADFTILPSYHETFGRAWVESFARKTPAISTSTANLKYLIKDKFNGFEVLPQNEASISAAIVTALDLSKENYIKMCENAYSFAKNFHPQKIIEKILEST